MPTYRIRAGQLDVTFKAMDHRPAFDVAICGVIIGHRPNMRYGEIMEVSGGKFKGDQVTYFSPNAVFDELEKLPGGGNGHR